ncbi:MAG: type II toxin-antitoxin system VapC family toxin [bacterium]|nr:type II toxin-antitoxin system VapC family toxin [bacterium]
MNQVFVDTSALIALGNTRDAFHQAASRVNHDLLQQYYHFVTTSAVILEFANAFSPIRCRNDSLRRTELLKSL